MAKAASEGERRAALGPPRFGLATLLLAVTVVCVILAVYTWSGAYAAMLVAFLVAAVGAHILGNWLGTQLRHVGNRPAPMDEPEASAVATARGQAEPHHFAPPTHLRQRSPLSPITLLVVVLAVAGGIVGGAALVRTAIGPQVTWAQLAAGAAAFGVLAGIWTFALTAFLHAGWKAWSDATRDSAHQRRR